MDIKDKRRLKQQLERQASIIVSEDNDTELVVSCITSCMALLRAAKKSMPEAVAAEDFERIYAGYLGAASMITSFCEEHGGYIESIDTKMGAVLENDKLNRLVEQYKSGEAALLADQKALKEQLEGYPTKIEKEKKKLLKLQEEKKPYETAISQLNSEISELVNQITKIKTQYDKLTQKKNARDNDLLTWTNDVAALRTSLTELCMTLNHLEGQKEQLEEEKVTWDNQVEEAKTNKNNLVNQINENQKLLNDYSKKLTEYGNALSTVLSDPVLGADGWMKNPECTELELKLRKHIFDIGHSIVTIRQEYSALLNALQTVQL